MKRDTLSLLIVSFLSMIIPLFLLSIYLRQENTDLTILHSGDPDIIYDGHYFYHLALTPGNASPELNVPAFRYQRIFYPLVARVLGWGQPYGISRSLLLINAASLFVSGFLLGKLLQRHQQSPWLALIYTFFIGSLITLRFDTSELLCYLLVMVAIWFHEEGKWWKTAIFFALAILTKELAILFWIGYVIHWVLRQSWRRAIVIGVAIIPYALWQIALWLWLGDFGFSAGGAGLSIIPLSGYFDREFTPVMALIPLMLWIPGLLCLVYLVYQWHQQKMTALGIALFLNGLLIFMMPKESSGEMRAVGRIVMGFVLAVLLYGSQVNNKRMLHYASFWLLFSIFFAFSLFGLSGG